MNIAFITPPYQKGFVLVTDLLHGCWCQSRRVGGLRLPPLPQLMLATIARKAGHQCKVIDAPNQNLDHAQLINMLSGYDLFVFHLSSASYETDRTFIHDLKKKYPSTTLAVYGAHPTFHPELFGDKNIYNHVIRYDPETEFAGLVAGSGTPDYQSMDDLPFLDYSLLPREARYFNPIGKYYRFATMATSRGCPGNCTFCTVPAFYGRKYRAMNGERVLREVLSIREKGYREIFFRDENFTASRKRVVDICRVMLSAGLNIDYIISSRIDAVDAELLHLLKDSGCRYIRYGVESGSEKVLSGMKKGITREMIVETFRKTSAAGIKTHAHFIVGLPGEGWNDLADTRELIRVISPDTLTVSLFTPLPGSELYEQMTSKGFRPVIDSSRLHLKAYGGGDLTPRECDIIEKLPFSIYREFYLRPSYILKSLIRCRSLQEMLIKIQGGMNVLQFCFRR